VPGCAPESRSARVADDHATGFVLPNVAATAHSEVGVILLGLDAVRLLTGLGMAVLADDPGRVAVTVDLLRHGPAALDAAAFTDSGARYWRGVRARLAGAVPDVPMSADPRGHFERVHLALGSGGLGELGCATRTYLAACWLRRADVDPAARPPAERPARSGGSP
jgi:Family of unknown function (DUF6187)